MPNSHEEPANSGVEDQQLTEGRRSFLGRGLRKGFELLLLAAGVDALINTAEGAAFISSAPEYSDRRACNTAAHFGDIGALVTDQQCSNADMGDSLARGCNDYNWAWAGPAQLVAENMNLVLASAGVPRPEHSRNRESPYLQSIMLARGGSTIAQIRHQVTALQRLEHGEPSQANIPLLVMSAGGNNAIQFLLQNIVPTLLGGFVTTFTQGFLPEFARDYKPMLADLIRQRETSQTINTHIFVLGVTDIGKSNLIPPMRLWGISQLATAACKRINSRILDIIDELQPSSSVQLHFVDIFTDLYGNPLTLGGIHPTRPDYGLIVDKIMARCAAVFPDGTRSFRDEQIMHSIRRQVAS